MMLTRRELLQLTTTATLGSVLPGWLSAAEPPAAPAPSIDFRRTVLLIELRGGNDGLNTVVPFADPAYRRLRPNLALGAEQIVPLTREVGLHRSLKSLAPAWKDGDLAVVQADDYGRDAIEGTLVALTRDRITLARECGELDVIHVHFPRAGYVLAKR